MRFDFKVIWETGRLAAPDDPHAGDRPVSELHPYIRLWRGFVHIMPEVESLCQSIRQVRDQFSLIDNAPRHDTMLDEETWHKVWAPPNNFVDWHLDSAARGLDVSLRHITRAARDISGEFKGQDKVRTEDRLARHLAEAKALIEHFRHLQMEIERPRQPYLIRQSSLSRLLLAVASVAEQTTLLRRSFTSEELPGDLLPVLAAQEAALLRLRATVARWRDNPSQKVTRKLEGCLEQVITIKERLNDLREVYYVEVKRLGVKFFNICGPVVD